MEAVEAENLIQYLSEIEDVGDEILKDKQEIINLDRRRNENREALRALKKANSVEKKSWMCFNNTFIKFQKSDVQSFIDNDQKELEIQIESLRDGLKAKIKHLNDLEGNSFDSSIWNLKSLSKKELETITCRGEN